MARAIRLTIRLRAIQTSMVVGSAVLVLGWLAPGSLRAESAGEQPVSDRHPSRIEGATLYLESSQGLEIARCGTEACYAAGRDAPIESQFCDLELSPEGCVRRWSDLAARAAETSGAVPPRQVGQSDADKPGYVPDCLGGRACVRLGKASRVQSPTLEIQGELEIEGPFSLFLFVRPEDQRVDFFYFGHGGSELVHRTDRHALDLRLGVSRPVAVTETGSVIPGRWQLIELHRDARSAIRGLVDGWDRTPGRPVMTGGLTLRHLFSIGRSRAMVGDVAAVAVYDRRLSEAEARLVRQHLSEVFGVAAFGDGSPPPKHPGRIELERRLWLDWSFDGVDRCRAGSRGQLAAALGPKCPSNAPRAAPGLDGGGLRFDGVDDEVRSVGPLGPMDQLYSFTATAWVKTSKRGGWQTILDKRDALEDGWDLYLDPEGRGFLRVDEATLDGVSVIADGEWHHLAGVFDGERLLLYVDGQLERSRYLGRRPPVETSREVAAGRNFAGRRDAYRGLLDELRIYGRALDPQEIQALARSPR